VKGNPGSVVGQQLIDAHCPAGVIAPLVLLAPPGVATAAATAARATVGVADMIETAPVQGYDSYSVVPTGALYGAAGTAAIVHLRQ
jgi:hypothetical protein